MKAVFALAPHALCIRLSSQRHIPFWLLHAEGLRTIQISAESPSAAISGTIIYKETVPPLLLSDAEVTLLGPEGKRTVPFSDVFDGRIHLLPSELLVSAQIPKWALSAQHFHIKLTAQEKIDYPLVSIAALIKDNFLRIAFSGVCSFPFRSQQIEIVLNNKSLSISERAERAASLIPEEYSDRAGSAEYRRFVFKNAIEELLEEWENG